MKKLSLLVLTTILGIAFSGCGDAYYAGYDYPRQNDMVTEVVEVVEPVQVKKTVKVRRVINHKYLRQNDYGYRYYY